MTVDFAIFTKIVRRSKNDEQKSFFELCLVYNAIMSFLQYETSLQLKMDYRVYRVYTVYIVYSVYRIVYIVSLKFKHLNNDIENS